MAWRKQLWRWSPSSTTQFCAADAQTMNHASPTNFHKEPSNCKWTAKQPTLRVKLSRPLYNFTCLIGLVWVVFGVRDAKKLFKQSSFMAFAAALNQRNVCWYFVTSSFVPNMSQKMSNDSKINLNRRKEKIKTAKLADEHEARAFVCSSRLRAKPSPVENWRRSSHPTLPPLPLPESPVFVQPFMSLSNKCEKCEWQKS